MVNTRGPTRLVAAYLLLIVVWIFSNPPGAAPDEGSHYLKALAAGRGELVPRKRPPPLDPAAEPHKPLMWMHSQSRMVSLPERLSPEVFGCRGEPARVAPCTFKPPEPEKQVQLSSYVATYPPTSYVIPGLLMRAARTTDGALYLGRSGVAFLSVVLLALAVTVLWSRSRPWLSVLGLAAAASPMVVFLSSSLSSSGVEAAAGISFFACLLRLTRHAEPDPLPFARDEEHVCTPSFVWKAAAFSGFFLMLTRDLGVLWAAILILAYLGWTGPRGAWNAFRKGGTAAIASVTVLALAGVAGLAWESLVQTRPPLNPGLIMREMQPSLGFLKEITRQQIGVFGPLDTVMPAWAYRAWWLLVLAMIAAALALGDWRRRFLLTGTIVGGAAITLVLDAAQRLVGFGAQGRHVLPVATAIALIAGEIIFSRTEKSARAGPAAWAALSGSAVAGVQLLAWYTIARRYSVGPAGPRLFFRSAVWAPPLGWPLWSFSALLACGLLLFSAVSSVFRNRPS